MIRELPHLSEEAILQLSTGELPPDPDITNHLDGCEICRRRLEDSLQFRTRLSRALPVAELSGKNSGWPFRNLAWASAAAAGVLAGIFWLAAPRRLNADQVLDRALRSESSHPAARRVLRIESAGSICQWGGDLSLASSCGDSRERLRAIDWDTQNPLSARAFHRWHEHLRNHEDRVEEGGGKIRLATTTQADPIRMAAVMLDAGSYKIVRLRLEPRSEPPIEIVEQEEELPGMSASISPPKPGPNTAKTGPGPALAMAQAEVGAWEALGRRGLLDGWSAAIERNSKDINIVLIGGSPETRNSLSAALAATHRVDVDLPVAGAEAKWMQLLPAQRDPSTGNPPLGEKWLKRSYDGDADQLSNRVLSLSRHLLGYSSIVQTLLNRRSALAACPCASRLEPLIAASRNEERSSLAELQTALAPLFGGPGEVLPRLNAKQVRQLDSSLLHVFSAAGDQSLEEELARIRALLRFSPARP